MKPQQGDELARTTEPMKTMKKFNFETMSSSKPQMQGIMQAANIIMKYRRMPFGSGQHLFNLLCNND